MKIARAGRAEKAQLVGRAAREEISVFVYLISKVVKSSMLSPS